MTERIDYVEAQMSAAASANKTHGRDRVNERLTKREYFAAMAMQGILATDPKIVPVQELGADVANWSVLFADAFIKRLNK